MGIWVVRAGQKGEVEDRAKDFRFALIGWSDLPDLSNVDSSEDIRELVEDHYGEESGKEKVKAPGQITNDANQIFNFKNVIEVNDICILPFKTRKVYHLGRCTGSYIYFPDNHFPNMDEEDDMGRHGRPVEWVNHIQRTDMPKDYRKFLGWQQTVFQVSDEDTVNWIEAKMNEFENANLR